MNISENTLVKILKYGIYASLLWFFMITPYALFPAHTGKVLFLQGLIEILAVFYLLLILNFPKYRPRFNWLAIAIGAWGGALILSAIFGTDFWVSIFSQYRRMTGLFFIAHILAFFLMITAAFRSLADWRNFFIVNVAIGAVNSLIAVYQKIDPTFLAWLSNEDIISRTGGLFGNPSLLAPYLVFILFIALYLFLSADNLRIKIFSAGSLVVSLAAIFTAGTRGTILGVFVGAIMFLFIYAIFTKNLKLKYSLLAMFLIATISGVFLWANQSRSWMDSMPIVKRAVSLNFSEFQTSTRKITWASAWEGFKDRPIFGWGPSNFNLAFDKNYNPEIVIYGSKEVWPTKVHNIYFEYLAESGAVGFFALIFLFVSAGYLLFRNFKSADYKNLPIFAVFVSLLIAHLAQNFFLFDTIYTYYMLFIIFGFILFLSEQNSAKKENESRIKLGEEFQNGTVAVAAILAIFLVYVNFNTYKAAKLVNKFDMHFLDISSPYNDDFRLSFMKLYVDKMIKFPSKEKEIEVLETMNVAIDDTITHHPNNLFYWTFKVQNLISLAMSDSKYLQEAQYLLIEKIKSHSNHQYLYLLLGQVYGLQKNHEKAIENYRIAMEINPNIALPHWHLGAVLYINGQIEEGLKELDIAYGQKKEGVFNAENAGQWYFWGLVYSENREFKKAIEMFEEAIKLDTQNSKYYEKLAPIYKELGDKENAVKVAHKAAELNPDLKQEAEAFIATLED